MKKTILFIALFYFYGVGAFAQSTFIQPNSVQLPNVSVLGTCSATEKGQQVFLTTDSKAYYCNGSTWVEMSGNFTLPYSGTGIANSPTHLFKLDNGGSGYVAQLNVSSTTNPNGGLFVSNIGLGNAFFGFNSNASVTNSAIKGLTNGTGFAGEFASLNTTPKALKTIGGIQLTGIGEAANKILVSDATGNATWQNVQGKTNYYNASNMDFFPNVTFTTTWNVFTRDNVNTRIAFFDAGATETAYMIAPVDLPDGAVITRMKSFYIDNTSLETLFVDLIRRNKTTTSIPLASEDIMATQQSAATNSTSIRTVQTTTVANATIDNATYYYFIKVKIGDCEGCDPTQNWRGNLLGIRDVELQYTY